jgi:hypothetical protein
MVDSHFVANGGNRTGRDKAGMAAGIISSCASPSGLPPPEYFDTPFFHYREQTLLRIGDTALGAEAANMQMKVSVYSAFWRDPNGHSKIMFVKLPELNTMHESS